MRRAALVLVAALACGRGPSTASRAEGPGGGLVPSPTAPGVPVATPVARTISSAGGSLASPDGAITIAVPPGALPSPTEVSVLRISNTARGGIGGAFRLGPEGMTFSAPVTLTFKAPESYPPGASIAGVAVSYQDRRGFWHPVEPVARDATAKTVSVTTDHFSDWTLTWQAGIAAAEGPIRLVQTVEVPFDAYGRATVFYQGEDDEEVVYLLTGTLTVPETVAVGDEVCVPDERTKTLPLNVAEIRKGTPPVFRWGIGAFWSLSCTAPGGAVTTRLMPALFDTMNINLTRCGGYYETGQVATPAHLEGTYTKNCGFEGLVSASWNLRACVVGQPCDAGGICRAGTTVCTDGIASCVDAGPAPNGTACGPTGNLVCSEAQCVDLLDQEIGLTVTPVAGLTTTESGGTATFQIALNKAPTTAVSVALSTDSPEGSVSPATVTFGPADWNVPQTVTVRGQDDHVDDGDVAYLVVTAPAVSADPRYSGKDAADVRVVNVDDDVAGIVLGPSSGLVTTERGGTATFQVALSSEPVADVTLQISSDDPTEGTASPATLTFTAGTWNVPQVVTVSGVDDAVADGAIAYAVRLVGASADPAYAARTATVSVTNDDDDTAGLVVSPTAGLVTTEAGGTASFTVALQSEPLADVTVPIASTNPAEGVPSIAQLVFTPADWSVPQAVAVTGVQDAVADGPVVYGVTVGPPSTLDTVYVTLPATTVELTNADDDFAGITVGPPSGAATSEGGTSVSFTVVLTSEPTADVAIAIASGDATEASVSPASLTFTAGTWNAPQVVTVAGVDDRVADGDQPFDVLVGPSASADPRYDRLDPADVRLTNADDDVAGLAISPASGLVTTEAGGTATFQVALRSQPTFDVTVAVTSGDATEGAVSPATITFTASDWDVSQGITVTGRNDAVADGTVAYAIAVAATSADPGYDGRTATVSAVNEDDDAVGVIVSPTAGLATSEGGGTASFTVVLRSEPAADVRIPVASTDATEGTASPSELVFTAATWNVPQTVTVTGVDDPVADGPVSYAVTVGPPASEDAAYATLQAVGVAVTNADDDLAGVAAGPPSGLFTSEAGVAVTFAVVLTSQPSADVSIPIASGDPTEGTASPASLTFTASTWNVPQTVTVTGVDDRVDDGDQPFTVAAGPAASSDAGYAGVRAANVQLVNVDDDAAGFTVAPASALATSEAGGTATFQLTLSSEPTADVTVAISSGDPTEGAVSPATVTFTPLTWEVPQVVTVTGLDDAVADGPVSYALVLAASSADATYAGRPGSVPVTNADDDAAGVVVSAPSGASTAESGTAVTFTVALRSEPTAAVVLPVASSDATEASVSPATLTFTAADWNRPQTVTVSGVDDRVDDGDQAFAARVGPAASADPGYANARGPDVVLTNVDDDVAGLAITAASGLTTTEAGGTATFELALSSEPTADVTVTLASSDPTEGTVSPASVTFTAASWNVPQAVTVRGVDDPAVDGPVPYAIQLAATSGDGGYEGRTASVPVTNQDDDVAGLAVSPAAGLTTTEAGGTATFQVALASRPAADVTVTLSSTDPTEGAVSPEVLVFTAATWDVAQPVLARGLDDAVADGPVAYGIHLASASGDPDYLGRTATVSATNGDDDVAGISVSPPSGPATTEAGGSVTFMIALRSEPLGSVSVPLSSGDPGEVTVSPATVVFTPGDWSAARVVTVTGVQDLVADGDRPVTIVIGAAASADAAYAGLDAPDVSLTNRDDDVAGLVLSPAAGLVTTEAGGATAFEVSLSSQPRSDVTVAVSSGDPTEGAAAPASVVFTAESWNVPQAIAVRGVDDAIADGPVAYAVQLAATSADPGYGGRTASVAVTNADDDVAGISVTPASGAATSEPAASTTLTVVLTSEPTADVSIAVSTSDATEGTVSPETLVFTASGWNVPQTVTVTGADDALVDGPVAYEVRLAARSADGAYEGRSAAATLTNADDDVAGIAVGPPSGPSTSEARTSVTFTLALRSQPAADVSIPLASSRTAEATVAPSSVVFTADTWNVPQTVTVTGVDDVVDDGDQSFTVLIGASTSADPRYAGLDPADVALTNLDDDVPGLVVSAASGATSERGGTATFQVSLASRPAADVAVALSTSDATEGSVAAAPLTFTPETWNVPQTGTVTGVDDAVADGAVEYAVLLASTSADPGYDGRTASVPVINADDDVASIAVSPPSGVSTSEAGTSVTFSVVLTSEPLGAVSIPVSSGDPSEGAVAPAALTFTAADWSVAQTVTVTGVDDAVADGNVGYAVSMGPSSSPDPSYAGIAFPDLLLTNVDDEPPPSPPLAAGGTR